MCWLQAILLWNVVGTSHSVMECAGYKPFWYGMCWVQAILVWNVLGSRWFSWSTCLVTEIKIMYSIDGHGEYEYFFFAFDKFVMLANLKVKVIVFKKMRQNSNDEEESELVVHGGFLFFFGTPSSYGCPWTIPKDNFKK